MGNISLYQINKSKKMLADIKMYLKKCNIPSFEVANLEFTVLSFVGTSDVLKSIAVDAHNNVWLTATNFNDSYIIKSCVIGYKGSEIAYSGLRLYSENISSLSDKFKVFYS